MDFVVGHPRSGTTFAAELLNSGGGENCAHELLAELTPLGVSLPTAFYQGRATRSEVVALLDHYRGARARIDSNWKLAWILPVVLETFPRARIVHLVRDPRDAVRSCVNLDFHGELRFRPEFAGDTARNFWLAHMPEIRRPDWASLSLLERNCAFWSETQRLIADGLARHPRVLRLRLEDLTADAALAESLFTFFSLPPPPREILTPLLAQKINQRLQQKRGLRELRPELPPFEQWTTADQASLESICGETAARLGYVTAR